MSVSSPSLAVLHLPTYIQPCVVLALVVSVSFALRVAVFYISIYVRTPTHYKPGEQRGWMQEMLGLLYLDCPGQEGESIGWARAHSLSRHQAWAWRALALTQVHHEKRKGKYHEPVRPGEVRTSSLLWEQLSLSRPAEARPARFLPIRCTCITRRSHSAS